MTKKQEFKTLLINHNWSFEYQDSFGGLKYENGFKERERIQSVLKESPSFIDLYNQYNPFNKANLA